MPSGYKAAGANPQYLDSCLALTGRSFCRSPDSRSTAEQTVRSGHSDSRVRISLININGHRSRWRKKHATPCALQIVRIIGANHFLGLVCGRINPVAIPGLQRLFEPSLSQNTALLPPPQSPSPELDRRGPAKPVQEQKSLTTGHRAGLQPADPRMGVRG